MQNILVTDRYYPNDPQIPHEFSYIITDIGEGKVLSPEKTFVDPMRARSSYGYVDTRAPEVQGHSGWSTKAEVFSFGVIACGILDSKIDIPVELPEWALQEVKEQLGKEELTPELVHRIVPLGLAKIIHSCLAHYPDERPTMREVVFTLDDLSTAFFSDVSGDRKRGSNGHIGIGTPP